MTPDMIFTSESVTSGHPDKLCDQISDAAIDAFLRQDPNACANIECAVATGVVFLAARFAAEANVDLPSLARKVIAEVGYNDGRFNARSCSILTSFTELPWAMREHQLTAIDDAMIERHVAHEQANVFGYACSDTPELMPLPISLAHRLARAFDDARNAGEHWLSPDTKIQVSIEYRNGKPVRIYGITVAAALHGRMSKASTVEKLRSLAGSALAGNGFSLDAGTEFHLNAGPPFEPDGPARHAGLTGRKNGIDTYGEIARHSGAALSGKDPSRIDRIGAYAARHAAKNIVAAGFADRCEVHLGYAIGRASPLSVSVETFGTGRFRDSDLAARLQRHLDFRPAAIQRRFALRTQPALADPSGFYRRLAVYGHFGRTDLDLPWEATELADALSK